MDDPRNFSSEFAKVHGPEWTKHLAHLIDKPDVVACELGTWLGQSAEWTLDFILTHPTSKLITVDTHEGSAEHHLAGIDCSQNEAEARARLARFGDRVSIVKGYSHEFLKHYCYPVDFFYIDASHDSKNVLRDSVLAFDLLKVGGYVCWDDLNWGVYSDPLDCPKLAIESFVAIYARSLEVVSVGSQLLAKKTA